MIRKIMAMTEIMMAAGLMLRKLLNIAIQVCICRREREKEQNQDMGIIVIIQIILSNAVYSGLICLVKYFRQFLSPVVIASCPLSEQGEEEEEGGVEEEEEEEEEESLVSTASGSGCVITNETRFTMYDTFTLTFINIYVTLLNPRLRFIYCERLRSHYYHHSSV